MATANEEAVVTETDVVNVVADGPVEKISLLLSQIALVAMILVIAVDIATRSLLNFSFEVADEMGGYMLLALTFLGLAVCQANDGFHRVTFVLDLLPPRGRIVARIVFDLATMALVALLLVQYWNFATSSRTFGAVAPTYLATPLWIPQSAMALGAAAFLLALMRTLSRNVRALRALTRD